MSGGGIISKPPSAILNEDNMGGGFLNQLGRFLPNTGTIMAPRTSGPADVKGNRQTEPAYQNKLLGIPLGSPSSKFSEGGFRGMRAPLGPGGDVGGYSKKEMKRYADKKYGASFSPTSYAGSTFMDQHLRFPGLPSLQTKGIPDYMMPSQTSVSGSQQKSKGIVKDATDISTVMSNISREKIRQANEIIPGSATETTYGQSQKMLGDKLGYSNRAEQIKKLKQQGLLGDTKPASRSVRPPVRSQSGYNNSMSGGVGANRSNSSGNQSAGSQTPSFSARNSSGSESKQKTLGLVR